MCALARNDIIIYRLFAAVVVFIAPCRRKLLGGEGDPGEHLAGILRRGAGGVTAFLGGHGVIENGDDELGVPLQPDDGELAQCHIKPPLAGVHHQLVIKQALDGPRDLDHAAFLGLAGIRHPGAEDHGVQHLYCGHQIGTEITGK